MFSKASRDSKSGKGGGGYGYGGNGGYRNLRTRNVVPQQ